MTPEDGDAYRAKLQEIKLCIEQNYERIRNGVDACVTVFTAEDEIRAHAMGVRLDGENV